jgi:hypothetical protein
MPLNSRESWYDASQLSFWLSNKVHCAAQRFRLIRCAERFETRVARRVPSVTVVSLYRFTFFSPLLWTKERTKEFWIWCNEAEQVFAWHTSAEVVLFSSLEFRYLFLTFLRQPWEFSEGICFCHCWRADIRRFSTISWEYLWKAWEHSAEYSNSIILSNSLAFRDALAQCGENFDEK